MEVDNNNNNNASELANPGHHAVNHITFNDTLIDRFHFMTFYDAL